jgi:hypothetical protein
MSWRFFITAAILSLLTVVLGGGCSRDSAPAGPTSPHGVATGPAGGGGMMQMDGNNPEGAGTEEDLHPLTVQSIVDYTQTAIGPWGPVTDVIPVVVDGQTYVVHRLGCSDPFTAIYQLPNGDITMSNLPLSTLVTGPGNEPVPFYETWQGPNGPTTIVSGDLMIAFKRSATKADIQQFINDNSLQVVMSCFAPPDPGETGNSVASFCFHYNQAMFATIDFALTALAADPIVAQAQPRDCGMKLHYYQGAPNDALYYNPQDILFPRRTRQINTYGVDTSGLVDMGPPMGLGLSDVTVAVMDDGVLRSHPDFSIPYWYNASKLSWLSIEWYNGRIDLKNGGGSPTEDDRSGRVAKVTHGTEIAGVITATTGATGEGVPSLAPRSPVLPIKLGVVWDQNNEEHIDSLSALAAYKKLSLTFKRGFWTENVMVTNESFGGPDYSKVAEDAINYDIKTNNRLYVASAGNTSKAEKNYPAAYDAVLGVTGLWVGPTANSTDWYSHIGPYGNGSIGSTYWDDDEGNDLLRTYPVSGIYGFCDAYQSQQQFVGFSTATPQGTVNFYKNFDGTSFAAPQVSALAALLYMQRPNVFWKDVSNRIIQTRNMSVESTVEAKHHHLPSPTGYPIAGPISFTQALTGW